jgi:hypothetical protein
MKTIEVKIYQFDELSEEAKEVAIENYRNENHNFAEWAVDDCSLFEPKHIELQSLFGEDYNFPLIKNNRTNIYFDTDRNSFLDCSEAIEITNDKQFLMWLGIDIEIEGLEDIEFNIFTPRFRNADTTIDFDNYSSDFDEVVSFAQSKFNNYIKDVLERISVAIDYRYSDEAITEDIEANEYEFLSNGKQF